MNREGRAVSWSALIHGAVVLLLVIFWKGEALRDGKTVVIDFSMEQPAPVPPGPQQPPQKTPVQRPVARPISRPQPLPRPQLQPVPAVQQPPPVVDAVHPAAESAAEAVLPYVPPRPQAPAAVSEPAPAPVAREVGVGAAVPPSPSMKEEEQKKRYLKEHFVYIRDSVMQKVSYPPMARKMGWQGTVTLKFVVEEDGKVSQVHVEKSSGFQLLDRSAVESVKSAAPFPKPPVAAELVMPINYTLE